MGVGPQFQEASSGMLMKNTNRNHGGSPDLLLEKEPGSVVTLRELEHLGSAQLPQLSLLSCVTTEPGSFTGFSSSDSRLFHVCVLRLLFITEAFWEFQENMQGHAIHLLFCGPGGPSGHPPAPGATKGM